jgi:hypothetical protein
MAVMTSASDRHIPLVVEPARPGLDPVAWAEGSRDWITEHLQGVGALLFRGFGIDSVDGFNAFVAAVAGDPLEYRERSSPRSQVMGNIYTSTDYPAPYSIYLHNENSYSSTWPMRVFFWCETPAARGGETPIADSRRIYNRINPLVRQRFQGRGVMYVRNFGPDLGLPWTTVFQTEDRAEVERYCQRAGITVEWLGGDRLRTRHVRPAIKHHPVTSEPVWFNHAVFFHVSTLEPFMREALLATCAADELPNNTFYGDGAEIEPQVLDHLRAAYEAEKVVFPYQRGDVMLVDNMLAAHGRQPYEGARRVMVAMAQSVTDDDVPDVIGSATSGTGLETSVKWSRTHASE